MSEHTPGPWAVSDSHGLCVHEGGDLIADLDTGPHSLKWRGKRADAENIVRCVNAHDDLLEACEVVLASLRCDHGNIADIHKLEGAIAKAKAERSDAQ